MFDHRETLTQAYSEPYQTYKMEPFAKIVSSSYPLTILAKWSIFNRVLNTRSQCGMTVKFYFDNILGFLGLDIYWYCRYWNSIHYYSTKFYNGIILKIFIEKFDAILDTCGNFWLKCYFWQDSMYQGYISFKDGNLHRYFPGWLLMILKRLV